jgi:hypothetical protein
MTSLPARDSTDFERNDISVASGSKRPASRIACFRERAVTALAAARSIALVDEGSAICMKDNKGAMAERLAL